MKQPLLFAAVVIWLVLATAIISRGGMWRESQDTSAAAALAALANAERASFGVAALTENPLLDKAAQMKAEDMAAKGYYSHTSPEGYLPFHWLDVVGYKYLNVGENLDVQFPESGTDTDAGVNAAFMNSPEHRANILLPQFTEIGTGSASGMYDGQSATFFVELFATPYPLSVYTPPVSKPAAVSSVFVSPKTSPTPAPAKAAPSRASAVSAAEVATSSTPVLSPYSPEAFAGALQSFIETFQETTRQFLAGLVSPSSGVF